MRLEVSSDDDEVFLFERVVGHLQSSYEYSLNDAVELVNGYYSKFTDPEFCEKFGIPVQNIDFFFHIEALGMADRVHYYLGLNNTPDERAFIDWQRSVRT